MTTHHDARLLEETYQRENIAREADFLLEREKIEKIIADNRAFYDCETPYDQAAQVVRGIMTSVEMLGYTFSRKSMAPYYGYDLPAGTRSAQNCAEHVEIFLYPDLKTLLCINSSGYNNPPEEQYCEHSIFSLTHGPDKL